MSDPQQNRSMRRDFVDRTELLEYLQKEFPQSAARDPHVAAQRGGRAAAQDALARVRADEYGKSRNFLTGAVTYLSPYIRYGVLSLAEVRDAVLDRVGNQPEQASTLIKELGFRDFFQRVYAEIGDGIWRDREESKTGLPPDAYAAELPDDIENGETGLACMDAFSRQLRQTGYLHNHARLWLAAYIVHWRRVRWQAGARWFLTHLLDGDPASNNLSWQWVAGVFSSKPYFFNRENLERFSDGVYCKTCPLYGRCDFEGSYETLEVKIFTP